MILRNKTKHFRRECRDDVYIIKPTGQQFMIHRSSVGMIPAWHTCGLFYSQIDQLKQLRDYDESGGRLNKKDGLTRYGDSHVKDKTS